MFILMIPLLLVFSPLFGVTTIECYQNEALRQIRPVLDEFVQRELREYPYLYVSQEEEGYNAFFEDDPDTFVLFAEQDGKKIGVLQAQPLSLTAIETASGTPVEVLDQMRNGGFNLEKMLFVKAFLMNSEERAPLRGSALLFERAVEIAKGMGKTQICFLVMVENETHPLKPWNDIGRNYKSMNVSLEMSWPTLQPNGEVKDETHIMTFNYIDIED